jgi:hypothetical protein
MEQHEGEQSAHLGFGQQIRQQPSNPDCLPGQIVGSV